MIYLVGWQYNGHDDQYPAWFEVNPLLKRPEDATAEESLRWLMREAKKYHTTVSLHLNMTDAYEDSPLWKTYVKEDLISKNEDGSLMVIGKYNGRKAYQVNYKNEWEKGYAQHRIQVLLKMLPLQEAGTVHIDAWFARASKGHEESMVTEAEYQKKICNYWMAHGVDVTSEFIIDYMSGLIPYAWWFNQGSQRYLDIPAKLYCGGKINPDLKGDQALGFLFGTSMHGEGVWTDFNTFSSRKDWQGLFAERFYLNSVPYFFLNQFERKSLEGKGQNRMARYSQGVEVHLADSTVRQYQQLLRKGDDVLFPAIWMQEKALVAYSKEGYQQRVWTLPIGWDHVAEVELYQVSAKGNVFLKKTKVKKQALTLTLEKGQVILVLAKE
ncbi:endo-alpha-N-acetylgalactosaminidase family protein [Rapidithrix thailandica]|uniref:Endo-alpha-N-acetylgalactosaminidase family protein n=1 Tax=Rapidithrix thailandica TaxID=413964 RepID=A0AAW9SJM1_9BACT